MVEPESESAPIWVANIRLKFLGSVKLSLVPQVGQAPLRSIWSARKRDLHCLQSTIGSVKLDTCPLASQTRGCIRIDASRPTIPSWICVISFHQKSRILFFSCTPIGP